MTGGPDLRAGRVDITPDRPLPLFGRQGQGGNFESITARLEANAMLFSAQDTVSALVSLDTLYPSQTLIDAVHDHLHRMGHPLPRGAVLFIASHTHNAPALDGTKPLLGKMDTGYAETTALKIATLLVELLKAPASSAQLSAARVPCAAAIYRRRTVLGIDFGKLRFGRRLVMAPNGTETIDQDLRLFLWRSPNAQPLAALWAWPCHAVSEPSKTTVSSDFPGYVRENLRGALGHASLPVLYLPGFSGDIRPRSKGILPILRQKAWFGIARRFARNTAPLQSGLVAALNRAMQTALATPSPVPGLPALARHEFTLPIETLRQNCRETAPITVQKWQIGAITLTATSAEVSHRYATAGAPLHLQTGCAQQVFGYLPTDAQLIEGGYEADGFAPAFGVPGRFHAKIEATLRSALTTGAL